MNGLSLTRNESSQTISPCSDGICTMKPIRARIMKRGHCFFPQLNKAAELLGTDHGRNGEELLRFLKRKSVLPLENERTPCFLTVRRFYGP